MAVIFLYQFINQNFHLSKISIARVHIPAVNISVEIYISVLEESGRQCKVKCDSRSSEGNYVFDAYGV